MDHPDSRSKYRDESVEESWGQRLEGRYTLINSVLVYSFSFFFTICSNLVTKMLLEGGFQWRAVAHGKKHASLRGNLVGQLGRAPETKS